MKVEVIEEQQKFPRLMIKRDTGLIILATSLEDGHFTGTVIKASSSSDPVGTHNKDWYSAYFEPFTGTLTLQND